MIDFTKQKSVTPSSKEWILQDEVERLHVLEEIEKSRSMMEELERQVINLIKRSITPKIIKLGINKLNLLKVTYIAGRKTEEEIAKTNITNLMFNGYDLSLVQSNETDFLKVYGN